MDVKLDQQDCASNGTNLTLNNQIGHKKKNRKKNKSKTNEIDAIATKLENCLHLKQNGLLVNGDLGTSDDGNSNGDISTLNNHEEKSQNEDKHAANNCNDKDAKIAPPPTSGSSKKKQKNRNKQKENHAQHEKIDGRQSDEGLINNNLDKIPDANNSGSHNSLLNDGCAIESTSVTSQPPSPTATSTKISDGQEPEISKDVDSPKKEHEVPTESQESIASNVEQNEQPNDIVIEYRVYENELQMPDIMALIQKDLSEPYSIYTYRYFIHNWPKLCFLALHEGRCVGAIVCKLDIHRQIVKRGYIAMLAVDKNYRKLKIGTTLVQKAILVSILCIGEK